MCRYVLAGIAVNLLCLSSMFAWEQLIRNPFYKVYYRLFDYSEAVDYGGADAERDYGGADAERDYGGADAEVGVPTSTTSPTDNPQISRT
jgi:hypothetical protein